VGYVFARGYDGFPHNTPSTTAQVGNNPGDNVLRSTDGPVFTKAADGVKWHTLDPATFAAMLVPGPRRFPESTITAPKIAKLQLVISYREVPTVSSIEPSAGTTSETKPAVTWDTGETQEAYQLIVVTSVQQDSSGRTPGSVGYDASTVSQPVWDSGKTYSATQSAVVGVSLDNGEDYYIYIRSWAPAVNNVEMPSAWTTDGLLSISGLDVAAPSVSIQEDADSYTLRVSIERVAPVGAEVAPLYYTLQRLDSDNVWQDVPTASQLSGAGGWQYYDPRSEPGNTHSYRVRGVYLTASQKEVGSPWVEVSAALADRRQWWLRDRIDQTLNRRVTLAGHEENVPKPQEVAYGAGAFGATVTHQGVRASRHQVTLRAPDAETLADLRALIDTGRTLVFVTAFGDVYQVQVGDNITVALVKAQPTSGESTGIRNYHMLGLELIGVEQ
jgi:hypothetical protein